MEEQNQEINNIKEKFKKELAGLSLENLISIAKNLNNKKYKIIDFIGRGGEAVVFKAIQIDTQQPVAIRIQPLKDKKSIEDMVKTQDLFKDKPYIHHLKEHFYSDDDCFFISISELRAFDLETYYTFKQFNYSDCIEFAFQMSSVLCSLKEAKVLHSDIKPSNILVDINKNHYELTDLGMAKQLQIDKSKTEQLKGGTISYAAPEQFDEKYNQYNCSIDIYSLGLVLLEQILHRKLTFTEGSKIRESESNVDQLMKQSNHFLKEVQSEKFEELQKIIKQMLIKESNQRIKADVLLEQVKKIKERENDQPKQKIVSNVDSSDKHIKKISTKKAITKYINLFVLIFFVILLYDKLNQNNQTTNNANITHQFLLQQIQELSEKSTYYQSQSLKLEYLSYNLKNQYDEIIVKMNNLEENINGQLGKQQESITNLNKNQLDIGKQNLQQNGQLKALMSIVDKTKNQINQCESQMEVLIQQYNTQQNQSTKQQQSPDQQQNENNKTSSKNNNQNSN